MGQQATRRILVVGAGAIGVVYGYLLSLAQVEVTFLIRPHRVEALSKPQTLYNYDDRQLKTFSKFKYITDPAKIGDIVYDYFIVTLDNATLSSETGQALTKHIGSAARDHKTVVILQRISLGLISQFIESSGLEESQVVGGLFTIHVYSSKLVTLPVHAPTDEKLLAQADWAYVDHFPASFFIDDSQPLVAKDFTEIYNANNVTKAVSMPAAQMNAMFIPFFAMISGLAVLGWPSIDSLSHAEGNEDWRLTVEAYKEIQSLVAPSEAVAATTEASVIEAVKGLAQTLLPLDYVGFYRYHHGEKVVKQDAMILRECAEIGEKKGHRMDSLKQLINKFESLAKEATK
jgi:hypothetical protein